MADQKISELTEDTSPDGAADFIPTVDTSASGNKKVKPNTILGLVNGLTEDTSPDIRSDFILSYDTSASAPKKIKPTNILIPRGALVYNGSDKTAQNYSAGVVMTWDSEIYDTDGIHDTSSNTDRLTVPSGVTWVQVGGCIFLTQVNSGSGFACSIARFNSAGAAQSTIGLPFANHPATSYSEVAATLTSPPLQVSAGDYFRFTVFCSDTSVTFEDLRNCFWMRILA